MPRRALNAKVEAERQRCLQIVEKMVGLLSDSDDQTAYKCLALMIQKGVPLDRAWYMERHSAAWVEHSSVTVYAVRPVLDTALPPRLGEVFFQPGKKGWRANAFNPTRPFRSSNGDTFETRGGFPTYFEAATWIVEKITEKRDNP